MDRFMQAMQEQLKNNQQLSRPLDRNSRMLRQQDLKNMLDRLESMARSGAKDAALHVRSEGEPCEQHDGRAEDAAHEVGGQAAEDDR